MGGGKAAKPKEGLMPLFGPSTPAAPGEKSGGSSKDLRKSLERDREAEAIRSDEEASVNQEASHWLGP